MVVWALMQTSLGWEESERTREGCITAAFHFKDEDAIPNKRIPGSKVMYSQELHGLVQGCLQMNPDHRVGVGELVRRTGADSVGENLQRDFRQDDELAVGSEFGQSSKKRRKK